MTGAGLEPTTHTVADVVRLLEQIAPPQLSESWDNTGLLLGDLQQRVTRCMTCLTLSLDCVEEAIAGAAEMVVTHHPLPFKPLARITTSTATGRCLWRLASHGISVYSPHTAWDSAADGINAQLAGKLVLRDIQPLMERPSSALGAGRFGVLGKPSDIGSIARMLTGEIGHCRPRAVVQPGVISRVALACGSGGSFLAAAAERDCQLLITGEATYHACMEARELGISMLMIGHFASEKFAMDQLATRLTDMLPAVTFWGSRIESDPVTQCLETETA